jgi:glycosyltransferase involved in cell wall biosynthesis
LTRQILKVGVYNEPSGGGLGGCETLVAVLAEALSESCKVDLIHHRPDLGVEQLAEFSGTNLGLVNLRYVANEAFPFGSHRDVTRRYAAARDWHADLSAPYDVFINFTHHLPPFCHARKGVLVILFPLDERPYIEFLRSGALDGDSVARKLAKRLYHEWEWRKRLDTYLQKVSISNFARVWSQRRWAVDSKVIYPPVAVDFKAMTKANVLLSVGRFASQGHPKRQLEMMQLFREMNSVSLVGWDYFSVGSLGESSADETYFESVRRAAGPSRGIVEANISRNDLQCLYERALIFWHAAGYGEDLHAHPEMAEHFGIVTVEAMAAGCVPIVFNSGGQPEIVEHGINGYIWNTLEELKKYTILVAGDAPLREQLSQSARSRAQRFTRAIFKKNFLSVLGLPI